ncbi:hypothetical protein Gotur_031190 [Gossypium turneri]
MVSAWSQTRRMKRLAVGLMTTPEYSEWWVRGINDNIPGPGSENSQLIEEYLRVVPTELEIIKQYFERKNVQKLEADKLRKGKNKAEEELDSLKTDYKKLRLSIRTAELGKTSELEKSLSESQKEKGELKDRVVELEGSLCQHRSRNSVIELKASLSKIEEMKGKIEQLEAALRSCEVRIEHLEAKEGRQNEQLHYFQDQVRNRDRVMGEAMVQIREVADHLQTLAVQADTLSVKYQLESDRGQELASLLKKIKTLTNSAPLRYTSEIKKYGSKTRKAQVVSKRNAGPASAANEGTTGEDSTEFGGQNDEIPREHDDLVNSSLDWSMNFQAWSGSSPENNPANPIVPDFDEAVDDSSGTKNPLPNHTDAGVNMVGEGTGKKVKENIAERCGKFRALVQSMMDNGEMEFFEEEERKGSTCASESKTRILKVNHPVIIIPRPRVTEVRAQVPPKIVIQKPTKFSYNDSKKVP